MVVNRQPLRRLLLLLLPLAFLLSACQTEIALSVNKDDTYTMSARIVRTAPANDKKACNDVRAVVEGSKATADQIEVAQEADADQAVCVVRFKTPQPINDTRAPFIQIRRSGDYFTAKLAPDTTNALVFSPEDQLRMVLTFPGYVSGVDSPASAEIAGKQVIWTNPEALTKGFTVTARTAEGLTAWQSFWLVIAILFGLFLIFTIAVIALRKTRIGARAWAWERSWLMPLSAAIVGYALIVLDWGWRQWRRARLWWRRMRAQRLTRSQGPEAVTSSIPIVRDLRKHTGKAKADRGNETAAAANSDQDDATGTHPETSVTAEQIRDRDPHGGAASAAAQHMRRSIDRSIEQLREFSDQYRRPGHGWMARLEPGARPDTDNRPVQKPIIRGKAAHREDDTALSTAESTRTENPEPGDGGIFFTEPRA